MVGVIVSFDIKAPEPDFTKDELSKFGPIFQLLEETGKKCPEEVISKLKLNHQLVIVVDPEMKGKKIGEMLTRLNDHLALENGYDASINEATGPISQHIFKKLGFYEMGAIKYKNHKSFSDLNIATDCKLMIKPLSLKAKKILAPFSDY